MFNRPDFSTAVSDIRALLADADPATAELDEGARSRLARIRQDVTARPPAATRPRPWSPRHRSWWPGRPQRPPRQPRPRRRGLLLPAAPAGAGYLRSRGWRSRRWSVSDGTVRQAVGRGGGGPGRAPRSPPGGMRGPRPRRCRGVPRHHLLGAAPAAAARG